MRDKLYLEFENLEDIDRTLDTLLNALEYLFKYYLSKGTCKFSYFFTKLRGFINLCYCGITEALKNK